MTRSKDIGTNAEKACKQCGGPRAKGRTVYCSDECWQLSRAAQEKARQASRMQACKRCGQTKELGTRGGKLCASCRQVVADSSEQVEYERGRRRYIASLGERINAGERIKSVRVAVPEGLKWCARCQSHRPLATFGVRKDGAKPASYCIPCHKSYNRERRVLINFGLTWDEYELLLSCQDYRCAICGGKPRKNALSVDHDHKTGEIRGLLCSRCNHKLLGSANDDPARLRKAADYLEQFAPREVYGEPRYMPGTTPPAPTDPLDGAA